MTGFCHDRDELARNPFAEMRYHALRRFANRLGFQPGSNNKEVSDMKNVRKMIAAFALSATLGSAAYAADVSKYDEPDVYGGVKVGMLECQIDGGIGYVIGSAKSLACTFKPTHKGRVEHYTGNIKKLGVDIGVTKQSVLAWAVFAPVAGPQRGALSGLYLGATAEATVVAGVGANVLIGGTGGSIILQPVSVTGQLGINVAAGGAALTLYAAN